MCIKSSEKIGSIAKKLSEVLGEVQRVPKRGTNDFHKYSYATEADILDAVRGALAARQVALVTDVEVISDESLSTQRGGAERLVRVRLTVRLVDGESGEWLESNAIGDGTDRGDKAVYKATTGAMKYWTMKTFMVSTGDDAEADDGKGESDQQRRDRNFKPRPAQGQQAQKPAATAPRPHSPADLAARGEAIAKAVEGIDETEDRRKAAVRYVADQCCRAGVWPDAAMAEAAIWKRLGQHHTSKDLAICWSALLAEHDQRTRANNNGRVAA